MKTYWIKFTDGTSASCQGESAFDAEQIAEHVSGKKVEKSEDKKWVAVAKPLPYPAEPAIWRFTHPIVGACPTFCHRPERCAGSTSCTQSRSCCD